MFREIALTEGNVTLTIYVQQDLSVVGESMGSLVVGGYTNKEDYHADNLDYFADIKEVKDEIKAELKVLDQHYKGVIKDIKLVFEEAKRLKLI